MPTFEVLYFDGRVVRDAAGPHANEPPADLVHEPAATAEAAISRAEAILKQESETLSFIGIASGDSTYLTRLGLLRLLADRRIGREGSRNYYGPDR